MKSIVYKYDGSWVGLCSAIFEAYERNEQPERITSEDCFTGLFSEKREIFSSKDKAERVIKKVKEKSKVTFKRILKAYLSEEPDREIVIYRTVRILLIDAFRAETDYGDPTVLRIKQIEKKIFREVHRMHAFVRFQKAKDDIYYAFIRPDFDVLPFLGNHFKDRYADQKWVIFDLQRNYGLYYDLQQTAYVQIDFLDQIHDGKLPLFALAEDEQRYQNLWKRYFQSANIKERNNSRLHLRHVPKRYWELLTEKQ